MAFGSKAQFCLVSAMKRDRRERGMGLGECGLGTDSGVEGSLRWVLLLIQGVGERRRDQQGHGR